MKTIRLFKVFLLLFAFSYAATASTGKDNNNPQPQPSNATMPSCATVTSTNVPVALPSASPTVTTDVISVPNEISIEDINVTLDISHTWVDDLTISLESPQGTTVVILDASVLCSGEDDIDVILDDQATDVLSCGAGTPAISGTVQPTQPLSGFNGENSVGDWTLIVNDAFSGDGGSINVFEMVICGDIPDNDGDGIEDALDPDDDNDGIDDTADNCQFIANADQADWDQDGIGNVCDNNTFITLVPGDAITPNGDGYNDTWMITNANFYPNLSLKVFNRWGKEVFVSNGVYNNDWNAESTEGGSGVLPAGSYYYVIEPNNPAFGTIGTTPLTGWIYVNY